MQPGTQGGNRLRKGSSWVRRRRYRQLCRSPCLLHCTSLPRNGIPPPLYTPLSALRVLLLG